MAILTLTATDLGAGDGEGYSPAAWKRAGEAVEQMLFKEGESVDEWTVRVGGLIREIIAGHIDDAIKEERGACAEIAVNGLRLSAGGVDTGRYWLNDGFYAIAIAIRARGQAAP
jgi:hypothetical protein